MHGKQPVDIAMSTPRPYILTHSLKVQSVAVFTDGETTIRSLGRRGRRGPHLLGGLRLTGP